MAIKMETVKGFRNGEVAHNVKARRDSRPRLTKEGIAAYDEMPLEEVRERAEKQLKEQHFTDAATQVDMAAHQAVFLETHHELWEGLPEATANANFHAIGMEALQTAEGRQGMNQGRRTSPEFWDFEQAMERAKRKGKLVLSQSVLARERVNALRGQVAGAEQDPYAMPLDELRRRANGVYDPLGPK